MKDRIVTVATHNFERAQLVKLTLENEGIECFLRNINLIQGSFSGGVKVRIKESDLEKALAIIERVNEEIYVDEDVPEDRAILVPVDFSDFTLNTCAIAMNLAKKTDTRIVFYHTYFNPITNTLPFSEAFTYEKRLAETLHELESQAREELEKFSKTIEKEIAIGRLPMVDFTTELVEGIPEERIIQYSKMHNPKLIIMGTRGRSKKNDELIGSVTAEVIDRAKVPVLAIPEDAQLYSIDDVKNIGYTTNFDKADFEAMEKLMDILQAFNINLHCFHVGHKGENKWDDARLQGMKKLLEEKYRDVEFNCKFIEGDDLVLALEKEIMDSKIDAIALTTHRRNIIARLFNPSMARKMLFHTNTPLLVFHA